jgi:hypothetical protein
MNSLPGLFLERVMAFGSSLTVLAGAAAAALSLIAAPAVAHATPHSAEVHNVSRGAVVRAKTADQVTPFLAAHEGLTGHQATARAAAQQIHPTAGTAFKDVGTNRGAFANQSVTTSLHPTNSGTVIYTPTMYPAGGSCIEVTTVYAASEQAVEAWDWCNNIDFEASVPIDSSFLSRYTNGSSAYAVQISQTNTSQNTWTASLYNYQTKTYDTLYTSSGSTQAGTVGWDINELYSDVDGNGRSYACADMSGKTFSSSGIQVNLNGSWQAASTSNSDARFDRPASEFDCADRSYQMIEKYDHWQVVG